MRRWTTAAAAALLATAIGPVGPAHGQDLTEEETDAVIAFMVGNSIHTLFHEAGHMLVSEFGLPVLGKEEDAVDNLATIMLLEPQSEDFDQALIDTADSFWYSDETARSEAAEAEDTDVDVSAYYDEHSLDLQRSYQVVCLMIGADAETFAEVADEYDLPAERREACKDTYQQAVASWDAVLQPHQGNASGAIAIVYDPPATEDEKTIAELLKDATVLEKVADEMTGRYALKPGITFRAASCGTVNAFWSPGDREVTLCYELAVYYAGQMIEWIDWDKTNGQSDTAPDEGTE